MVRGGPVLGPLTLVLLLTVLTPVTGLGTVGWFVGLACGAVAFTSVAVGLVRYEHTVGPADVVTIVRLAMGCAVAALVAESFPVAGPDTALVTLATVALVLDAVDGKIARLTGTISAFGAKLDGEVDAFLMLVLSVYVAASTGWWVLSIGLVRYVFAAAGWVLPWMRGTLPPRFWRKVVTATEGIVLTVAMEQLGNVSAEDAVPKATAKAKELGFDVPVLVCTDDDMKVIRKELGVELGGLPQTLGYDRAGSLVVHHEGIATAEEFTAMAAAAAR